MRAARTSNIRIGERERLLKRVLSRRVRTALYVQWPRSVSGGKEEKNQPTTQPTAKTKATKHSSALLSGVVWCLCRSIWKTETISRPRDCAVRLCASVLLSIAAQWLRVYVLRAFHLMRIANVRERYNSRSVVFGRSRLADTVRTRSLPPLRVIGTFLKKKTVLLLI